MAMTDAEQAQVAEGVRIASRYRSITEQFAIERGEYDADALLTREWKRIGRIMRAVLAEPGRVEAATSVLAHYRTVFGALCIVRREGGRPVPADRNRSSQAAR
jgi:hypothetical protein